MILNDIQITHLVTHNQLISPFVNGLVREEIDSESGFIKKVLSYGLSSYGYDIRMSPKEFKIFKHIPGTIIDPKKFNKENLVNVSLQKDSIGDYFVLPAHTYGLCIAVEKLQMPDGITAIAIGKSTYARCGIICNLTPIEAGWCGNLTIEISNSSDADCKIYANEGICQLLFFKGETCKTSYDKRNGKYQNQPEQIVLARI